MGKAERFCWRWARQSTPARVCNTPLWLGLSQSGWSKHKCVAAVDPVRLWRAIAWALAAGLSGLAAPSFSDIHQGLNLLGATSRSWGWTEWEG